MLGPPVKVSDFGTDDDDAPLLSPMALAPQLPSPSQLKTGPRTIKRQTLSVKEFCS